MAVPDAVRRTGSLLLRALTVGGLATTAWLLGTGAAAAEGQDHPDEASMMPDVVNMAFDQQRTATEELLTALLADHPVPTAPATLSFASVDLVSPVDADQAVEPVLVTAAPEDEGPTSFSGGTESRTGTRTGAVTNTIPAPLYEAKLAAKAAAHPAAHQTPEPSPAPEQVPADVPPAPEHPPVAAPPHPAAPPTQATPVEEPPAAPLVTWENPEPAPPAPAPTQAPAPTAPTTASSTGHDSSNGHRGGVIASATSQSGLIPPAVWSVEQREDGRSPGSVPGLPSTSPD
ncbi:hypothetical protein AB0I60_09000 [Actinosynnema sp. NPDC050436]|uniref:hypothetical protein n=1 Tax=Actinosynnema sp. NPDC050436 TaxID=3155659 RepID=UPI0033C5AA24